MTGECRRLSKREKTCLGLNDVERPWGENGRKEKEVLLDPIRLRRRRRERSFFADTKKKKKGRRRPREISHRFPPLFLFDPGPFYVHLSAVQTSSSSSTIRFLHFLLPCKTLNPRSVPISRKEEERKGVLSRLLPPPPLSDPRSYISNFLPPPPEGPSSNVPHPPFLFKAAAASWGDGRDKKACLREDRPLCNLHRKFPYFYVELALTDLSFVVIPLPPCTCTGKVFRFIQRLNRFQSTKAFLLAQRWEGVPHMFEVLFLIFRTFPSKLTACTLRTLVLYKKNQ